MKRQITTGLTLLITLALLAGCTAGQKPESSVSASESSVSASEHVSASETVSAPAGSSQTGTLDAVGRI